MNFESYREQISKKGLKEDEYLIGIDLGTTHSVISFWNDINKLPEPIDMSNGFGKIPMPSVVQFRKEELNEEWIVGEEASNSTVIYPETTISSVKTLMGSNECIKINNDDYSPEEITSKILTTLMKQIIEINPKSECVGVVVSVPYDFDDAAKKATIRACQLAGLSNKLICLIEEPKAAALAYNYHHPFKKDETIMVFDFGGGTLDITLFKVISISDKEQTLKVLSEGGETKHGGDVLDNIVFDYFLSVLKEKDYDIKNLSIEAIADLKIRAKETKERLSGAMKIRVPFTSMMPPFVIPFTRNELEKLGSGFIDKTKNLIYRTLQDAYQGAVKSEDIDKVLLEGGSSQMPWVKELMAQIFKDEGKIYLSDRPALDISLGATIYAAMKMGIHEQKDIVSSTQIVNFEVCLPHDIGFEVDINNKKTFYSMISRGTPYHLARRAQVFTVQGETTEDMTKLSLRILERIHKDKGIDGCHLIGDVEVVGLPKRPTGETQLKVELSIEENTGSVKGKIKDIGYKDVHDPSGFEESFIPQRHKLIELIS